MPGIPQRSPLEGAVYPSQKVGERIAEIRRAQRLSQEELAERMETLGHTSWRRQTVGQVETAERNLTVDELVSIAFALNARVGALFNPWAFIGGSGWSEDEAAPIDLGYGKAIPAFHFTGLLGFDPTGSGKRIPNALCDWRDMARPQLVTGMMTVESAQESGDSNQARRPHEDKEGDS